MTGVRLRVGELAERLRVSTHALRAWESRYQLFRPERSAGGYRLYDEADVRRGELMCERIALGTPAGEAARLVLRRLPHESVEGDDHAAVAAAPSPGQGVPAPVRDGWRQELAQGCAALDEPAVRAVLAQASSRLGTDDFVDEIVVPLLRALALTRAGTGSGAAGTESGVACGTAPGASYALAAGQAGFSIAHAHFAGDLVRSALLARQRRALPMGAPRLWLVCPPRELHDLGLMAFGLVAAEDGWAVRFFGANAPLTAVAALARRDAPSAVVVAATRPAPLRAAARELNALAGVVPTAVGGPAARRAAGLGIATPTLCGDIVGEAHALAATLGLSNPAVPAPDVG